MTLYTSRMTQVDEVRGGGSYLSSNDQRLHFGLGPDRYIQKVEIDWPSGLKEEIKNLQGDAIYTILEGHGVLETFTLAPPR
jgi:hypothetical protein